jgi:hypothetical protein
VLKFRGIASNPPISVDACVAKVKVTSFLQHRGKTSAHAPNYENMAGNLNINFQNKNMLIHWSKISKTNEKI